jgi:hypothetical protein
VFIPLEIEFEGITIGIVLVVALEELGAEGVSESPLAFLAVTLATIG